MARTHEDFVKYPEGFAACGMDLAALSSRAQTIAAEAMEYTRKNIEDGGSLIEALSCAKSLEDAADIHARCFKQSYAAFVSEAGRIGGLYADLAKEAYKPFESLVVTAG